MFEGTPMLSNQSLERKESLLNWKEFVINVLNESYKEDDSNFKPKES